MTENMGSLSEEKDGKFDFIKEFYEWTEAIVYPLAIIILVFSLVFRVLSVEGISMENTLNKGVKSISTTLDRVILSDFNYTPKKGDIVAIHKKVNEADLIVKRIIAVGGDTVNINFDKHIVYVNGKALKEPYVINEKRAWEYSVNFPEKVPKDCYFVMGDNRNESEDSRYVEVGFINKNDIIGRAYFRIFPFNRIGFLK